MYKNYISLGNSGSTTLNNSVKSGVSTLFGGLAAWQKKAFLALLFAMFSFMGNAQVSVTGTTAGTTAVGYTTLNAAFTAINAGTHKGVITVLITGNTTEPATAVPLLKSAGTSSYTAISIKPSGGNFTINSAATPTASKGVIIFSGADNVTIDGDDTGTAGAQNLSIVVATNASTGTAAIQLASNSTTGTDGADNNTIKNCIITGGRNSATSTTVNYGIVMSNISLITTGAYSSINTTIQNNIITRAYHGIYAAGTSATYPNTGTQILNNTIGSATSASNIGSKGIYLSYSAVSSGGATISGNDIRVGDYGTTGYSASIAGIEIATVNYGFTIKNNNIHDVSQPTTSGWGSYGILISGATNCTLGYIQNNIIRDITASNYTTTLSSTFTNYGIYFSAGATGVNIDYNTIVLKTANATGTTVNPYSCCLSANVSGVRISSLQNNIFVNSIASTNAYAIYTNATLNISGGTINNNDYYVPTGKVGYYNAASATTLGAWQTATSKDASSINVNPPFISATDLHIDAAGVNAVNFSAAAAVISGITTDYDGATRDTNRPDIGADEFVYVPSCASTPSPIDGATSVSQTASFSWAAVAGAKGYDVYLNSVLVSTSQTGLTYTPSSLAADTTHTWKVVPKNATGCSTWSFTTQAAVPTLSAGALTAFNTTCIAVTSAANSFTISALNLTGDITLAALTGYSYCATLGGTYTSTLTITPSSGSISTTVYVKFTPSAATTYSGNIVISGGGLGADVNVAASGTGANPMGGTYTVGAGQDYTTLTAAVAAYNGANCFSGPVVFNLMDSAYSSSETFPITINANANAGTNTLTIKPNTTTTIIGSVASGALIRLNGAGYVILDGSNSGGTDKSMTITNSNTTSPTAIALYNLSNNSTIRNLNISTGSNAATSYGIALGGSTPGTTGADIDNITISNNNINTAYQGIYVGGTTVVSAGGIDSLVISNNSIGSTTLAKYVLLYGMNINGAISPSVTGNTVFNMIQSGSISNAGINIGDNVSGGSISGNNINGIYSTSASGYGAYGINFSSTTGTTGVTVANNIIYNIQTANYSTSSTTWNAYGIRVTGQSNIKLYYNSVHLYGAVASGTNAGMSAALVVTTASTGLDVRNNIFVNTQTFGVTGSSAYSVYYPIAIGTVTFNRNDYYGTSGTNTTYNVGYGSAGATNTLANWAAFTVQDANSISSNPLFATLSSYITNPLWPSLATTGTPLAVTTDYLGATRSGSTPSMGAYEGVIPTCVAPASPTALTYGTAGPSTMPATFTPNGTAPDGYLVVRYPSGSTETAPTNGTTTYAIGDAIGAGTISNSVAGSGSSFTVSGLSVSTPYDIYVYPYTLTNCTGGPVFGSALMGTNATSGCPSLAATINVGASETYTTLTELNVILTGCPITQNTLVVLKSDYNTTIPETLPLVFTGNAGSGAYTTTIQPDTAVSVNLTAASTSALFDISGAKNYIFDGRAGGSGSSAMTIHNTGNGAAMRLYNDAQNNIVEYITLKAANTSATNGVVRITSAVSGGTTLTNGNNNNTITYCNIDGTGVSPNGIYTVGSSAPADNKSNSITNNNIYDNYSDAVTTSNYGIFLGGANAVSASSAWTISGNSFYQTVPRVFNTTTGTIAAIGGGNVPAGAYTITGNYIGGRSATNGGAAMTLSGSAAYVFAGMNIIVGGADASTISNNTVGNINVTTASTSTSVNSGLAISSIGGTTLTVSGNTIGSASSAGAVTFSGGSGAVFNGLNFGNVYGSQTSQTYNITNNTIAGVAISGANSNGFTGITVASGNLTLTNPSVITGNTIGASSGPITNTTLGAVTGINCALAIGATVNTNTIQNMSIANAASTAALMGINVSAGAVTSTINNNTITNLTTNSANVATTTSAAITGIQNTAAAASISNNTINSLTASANAANTIHGIYNSGTVTAVNKNFIYDLSSSNASATASVINGLYINGGVSAYSTNLVRLGTVNPTIAASIHGIFNSSAANTNNFYFNSIYIGGSAVGTTASDTYAFRSGGAGNRTIQNNIFVNARSNGSTGGKHYAIRIAGTTASPSGVILNNNDYFVSGTGGTFGFYNSLDVASLSAWKTAVGLDSSSFSADPYFNGATSTTPDLTIDTTPASVLESQATTIAGITTDYSGTTRNASTPDIGAYEFAGTSAVPTLSITSIAPSTSQCVNTARLVTVEAVAGGTTLVSGMVTLAYSINGATATVVNMNNTSGNTWTYSIPVVTPEAAAVTWTVNVNDGTYSITKTGTPYQDNPLINYTAGLAASTNALCSGSPVTLTATVTPPGTATYCTPGTVTASSYYIQNFSTTGGSTNISNLASGLSTNNYGDYSSAMSVAQSAGNTVGFTVQANGVSTYAIRMFVDWNQNGTFEDTEIVYSSGSYVSTPVTNSFTVPATALNGTTRMRVTLDFLNSATVNSSCSFSTSSETEDYAFVVSGATTNALLPTAYEWFDGATSLASGSSNSYSPDTTVASTATKVYSATYTAQGCTKTITTTQSVVVTALPTAPTTTDSTQCGTTVPTCSAAGGTTGQYRWYTASTGGTAIAGETASTLSTYVVSASTTLYVAINNGTCESTRTPVSITVNTPPTLTVNADQTICNGAVGTLAVTSTLGNYDTYTWSPVTNLFTNNDGTGAYVAYTNADTVYVKSTTANTTTYTLTASMSTGPSAGCSSTATTTVVILPNPTVTTGTDTYCLTGTPSVTLSTTTGYTGGSIAWAYSTDGSSYTPIGGATIANYTAPSAITTSTYYQATIKDGTGTTCSTPSTLITVNNPTVDSTTPNTRCGTGTVALGAIGSAGATLSWFANATGGTALGTGTSFTTPSIATSTTYYVEASKGGGGTTNTSKLTYEAASTATNLSNYGQDFTATIPFTLNSVQVFSTTGTAITISLYNSSGTTELYTTNSVAVTAGSSPNISCGWTIPAGTYRLIAKAMTGNFYRDFTGATYPLALPFGTLNGYVTSLTQVTPTTGTTYYFLYNWSVSTGCTSATRTAVTATVTSPPGLSISSPSATICAGASTTTPVTVTSTVADFDTYTWSPTTVSGDTSGYTFTPVAASGVTTYTLTASNAAGCSNTATFNVTVNPAPSFTASASPATICDGAISTLNAVLPSPASTYAFASTTGGTLDAMSGATTITGTGIDQTNSGVINFPSGFVFNYEGTPYTNFNLTPNGVFGLGSTLVSTAMYGTITSATVLSPLGQDMDTGGDGGIVSLLTGTAPNRIFKVQWQVNHTWSNTNPFNNTFQLWLYEDGRIQYVYGALASTGTPSNGIGICGASTANYKSVNVTAGTVSSATVTSNATLPASGTVYTFTPPVTSSVSWTPITTLYTNNTATTPYTSLANALTVYAKPTSLGLNNYVALATDLVTSCTATQTVGVTVTALPTAPVAHDAHQCGAGIPVAYVTNPNTFVSASAPVYNVYADNNPATALSYTTTTPTSLGTISATTTLYISIVSPDTGCESVRTALIITVDSTPSATISYAGSPFCATTSTGTDVTLTSPTGTGSATGTYTATAGLEINATTGAIDPTTSTPGGPYTVTYTMDGGGCGSQIATTSVTVNAVPNSGFSYSAANYCTSGGTTSPTITGTAGTFTASPSGLSINATTGVINLSASAAGTYDITNTVSAGGCSNSVTTVTGITITTAVNITTQPSSVSKLPSESASFTVAATGTGTLTYQWQYSTGSGWFDLSDSGVYSNTTTTTLNISAVAGLDAYQYRAIVTGTSPCASAPSDAATLTVNTISFTLQPATQTICSDSGVAFTVTTSGGTPTTYNWQYRSSSSGTFADISGAYTDTYTISSGLTAANTGNQYRCVVDEYISPLNSAVATLTVNDLPAFSVALASQTVCTSAASVTFTANATGTGLSYQWEEYTTATPTWTAISLATASTYVINTPTTALSGNQYRVVVTGQAPAPCNTPITSAVATLTVHQAVAIGSNPTALIICPSTTANFSVASVTGDGLVYQWYATNGGIPIALTNGATGSGATVSGATSASLSVATPLEFNNYSFYCVVSGIAPCSSATSTSALLTLYNKATYSIGAGGDFTNLTTAIAQLQTCGITQATALELNASYNGSNEPAYPVVLPAISGASATNTLTIREASGVSGKVLNNGSITPTALATIDMNAGTYWIIDGRVGGTGSTKDLQITNSNLSGTAIRFINDASYNTVKYVDISGVNNTITGGVVLFATATTTGNDYNTIDNCNIRSAATNPVNGVYAAGTAAKINDNNTLSNNNVYDYFSATLVTNGINIASNSGVWSITGNRLYQTANRIYTTGNTHNGINIATGDGYTISDNVIGFADANGSGTTNMIGNSVALSGFPSAYTTTGTANVTRYIAINAAFTAAGTVSNIQNNTIAGFALYTSSGAATTNGIFCGINVTAGNVNIGTTTGNTIGATSGKGSIYTACTSSGGTVVGIYTTSANTVAIQNNTIGAIDASGTSSASVTGSITGIDVAGSGSFTVSNNVVGNSTATNLRSGTFFNGTNLTNSTASAFANTGSSLFVGIRSAATGTTESINSNIVRNAITYGTGASAFTGIINAGAATTVTMNSNAISYLATAGTAISQGMALGSPTNVTVDSNTIDNISRTGAGTFYGILYTTPITMSINNNTISNMASNVAASTSSMYAIYSGSAPVNENITNNTIYNISTTATGAQTICGWYNLTTASGIKNCTGNTMYGFSAPTTGSSVIMFGIRAAYGTTVNISGNKVYNFSGGLTITGIYSSSNAAGTTSIFKNKVYDLSTANTGAAQIIGLSLASTTTSANANVYNNLIGDLRATAAVNSDAIRGISLTASGTTSTYGIYNNTVYLNATSGATFGTSGIYHTTSLTATTAKLDLQNNIVINTSTPGSTAGVVTALRRSSTTLTNFATTSNKNMYFAGTAAANKTIMYDGTNAYQTYGTYFTAVGATREANSFVDTAFSAATFFTATTGSSSTYLQPNTGITTLAESGGNNLSSVLTDDYNSQTRPVSPGTAYDLGAWEFAGTTTAPVITFTSVTPSTQQCTASARTIVASVTTAGGTLSSVTLNYSYNGTAQTPVTMSLVSGSSYSGVIPAPTTPANATVTWSIAAVNSLPLTTTYTGTSYSDAPLTGVSATAVATLATVCEGSQTVLSADFTKYSNTFESGISNFTLVTNTAGTGAGATLTQNATYFSQGANSMYLTTPNTLTDASANLNTNINLNGMGAAILTFSHIAVMESPSTSYDFGYVEYSTNGGTSWTTFPTTSYTGAASTSVFTGGNTRFSTMSYPDWITAFTSSGSTPTNSQWKNETLTIPAAALTSSQFRIRFRYTTDSVTNYYGWLIDNVKIVSSTLPITNYSWATTAAPSTEIGTGNNLSVSPTTTTSYVATLTASGCTVASNAVAITVNPTSVGGTVASDQAICTGSAPASLTLTGNTGTVTKWQKSLTSDFASATDIAGTSTTLTGATIGTLTATTYFRAVVQSGSGIGACATANSAYATVTVNPTSVGGTVAGNQTICAATSPSTDLTLSSNTGDVVKWQKSLTIDFASATDITSTSTTLSGATIGNLSGTTYFRAVVQSGACASVNSTNYVTVTVNSTVAGVVSGGAATCSGSTSGLLTVADYTGSIVRWESSVSPFTTWNTIANTTSTYTSGALTETTQFRAVINNASCGEANATPTTVTIASTTWNGTAWSNGSPSSVKAAIIDGNLTTAGSGAGDLTACSLTVNAGYTVIVTSGDDFNISGAVNVDATSTLTFNNNADLLQGTTATTNTNSGSIISKRNASMRRLEYVYWSAPVANQNLLAFSPLTLANRFYTFDEPTNAFVAVASPSTTTFGTSESQIAGKGFMIRAPNTFLDAPAAPQAFSGSFTGVPNNGTYTTPVSNSGTNHGYNLIGNPYPSPIDADLFLAGNPGTLYFWTHATLGTGANNYASYTTAGATAAGSNGATCNGTIQTGQGFLILTTTNGNATFTNAMRLGNNAGQFFKTATTEKHRIWLNLNSATATFNQIMVGYIEGATQGVDTSIDGSLLPYGSSALSSRIDNADYVIQGRALPFASADTVPLGFNAAAAGEFTISIDHVDGLFLGSQDIYLRDNLLGTTYNIKASPYTFTSASGVFNNRFEIVYTSSPLGTHNPTFDSESVVVYKQDQVLNVNSGTTVMAKVRVFDVRGRLIFEKNNINATAVKLTDLKAEQQVLMVQITSDDNRIVTKKVVY